MLNHYLKISLRIMRSQRLNTLVTVTGLAVSMACSLLIGLYIYGHLRFDRSFADQDRIYRQTFISKTGQRRPIAPAALAPYLARSPQVERVTRVLFPGGRPVLVEYDSVRHYESRVLRVDAHFFGVFDFPFTAGKPGAALLPPNGIVLSQGACRRYFGSAAPLGRRLVLDKKHSFTVTGVIDPSFPTHLEADFILPLEPARLRGWEYWQTTLYVKVRAGAHIARLERQIYDLVESRSGKAFIPLWKDFRYVLQPLAQVHFTPGLENDTQKAIAPEQLYLFGSLGLLVLLLAAANYVNITTARTIERLREVAIRKVFGATFQQVLLQYLTEAFLLSLIAGLAGMVIVFLLLPFFNLFIASALPIPPAQYQVVLVLGPLLIVGVGLLAGTYPLIGLPRRIPARGVPKHTTAAFSRAGIRQGLVVFQFGIAAGAIGATLVMHRQLVYMQQQELGYDLERVLVMRFPPANARQFAGLREELLRNPSIAQVGAAAHPLGAITSVSLFHPEGWNPADGRVVARYLAVDPHFLNVVNLESKAGNRFCPEDTGRSPTAFLINEAAAREFGLQHPVGKTLTLIPGGRKGYIVGVLKNFNYAPLFEAVQPLVVGMDPSAYEYIFVKLKGDAMPETLKFVGEKWREVVAGYPLDYFFQQEYFNGTYGQQEQLFRMLRYIAGLAVCIAGLGLFSLSAFMTQRRKKEIGVRKALGASVSSIIILLARDCIKLVLLGNLIAGPLVWYGITRWLECFPDRISIRSMDYVSAAAISVAVALAAQSIQVIKAATVNPVAGLQTE